MFIQGDPKKAVITKIWIIFKMLFIWLQNFTYISDIMSSKSVLKMSFLTMSGFQTRHIFCYRVMWTSKTSSSSEAHPLSTVCTTLHSLNGTDWVAIWKHKIIRPLWFEDDNEHCVTINTDRYVQVLRKFLTSFGRPKYVIRVRNWFQQYGATPPTSKESL